MITEQETQHYANFTIMKNLRSYLRRRMNCEFHTIPSGSDTALEIAQELLPSLKIERAANVSSSGK
jgi:hypothetical protein